MDSPLQIAYSCSFLGLNKTVTNCLWYKIYIYNKFTNLIYNFAHHTCNYDEVVFGDFAPPIERDLHHIDHAVRGCSVETQSHTDDVARPQSLVLAAGACAGLLR